LQLAVVVHETLKRCHLLGATGNRRGQGGVRGIGGIVLVAEMPAILVQSWFAREQARELPRHRMQQMFLVHVGLGVGRQQADDDADDDGGHAADKRVIHVRDRVENVQGITGRVIGKERHVVANVIRPAGVVEAEELGL